MSLDSAGLKALDAAIQHQFKSRTLESGLNTALAVLDLVGCRPNKQVEDIQLTKLPLPNAERYDHWFQPHPFFKSNRSCFDLLDSDDPPLQAKFFWLAKKSKLAITGGVHFSPNWEDSEFTRTKGYKVGIDFFLSENAESLLIVLSDRGSLRIVELSERLRITQLEIFSVWAQITEITSPEILHNALWKTFQLQAVNEKFYIGVANAFTELVQHIDKNVLNVDSDVSKQFANRLIGRLLFCWFLKKREIINKSQSYFDTGNFTATEYYQIKLEPLFFLTLNTRVKDRADALSELILKSKKKVKPTLLAEINIDLDTPYLNGGLFENHPNDFFGERVLTFPDGFFVRLYEHFDSYNFTTDESSPDYEQIAIDPEMLGKVFESLLATQVNEAGEQARQATGAFYTPRTVVSNMCKEAIRGALGHAAGDKPKLLSAIDGLIDTPDSQWAAAGSNSKRDILKGHAEELEKLLMSLKILDPACGSGAFPLGMLQLLVKLGERITPKTKPYDLKIHFLNHTIYGADIEPMAIEISKLRAWLSLIVDEENHLNVHVLPNLDFHFVCCNSLIRLDDEVQSSISFTADPSVELDLIRQKYFMESEPKIKRNLQRSYQSIIDTFNGYESNRTAQLVTFNPFIINSAADFFDKVEMFGIKGGFDIVIGNPPYIRQEKVKYKNKLQDYKVFNRTADLYTYFYEMGVNNLRKNGVLSFITSSKFGRAQYGEHLRRFLSSKTEIDYIINFGDTHVFSAVTNTWVVQLRNADPKPDTKFTVFNDERIPQMEVLQCKLDSEGWVFLEEEPASVKAKIEAHGDPLRDHSLLMMYGVKTGCNEAFIVNEEVKEALVALDAKNSLILKPILRGRDILRYEVKEVSRWLIAADNTIDVPKQFPSIANFLEDTNTELGGVPERRVSKGMTWLNIGARIRDSNDEKIVWMELTKQNRFGWSTKGEQVLDSAYRLEGEHLKYYLGVLNSRVILFYFNFVSNSSGMNTTQWKQFAVEKIRIPRYVNADKEIRQKIENLVSKRLLLNSDKLPLRCSELEEEIEQEVRSLYSLNSKESLLIDNWLEQHGLYRE